MRIDIISLFPAMFEGFFAESILKRAVDKGIVQLHVHDLRKFGIGKHLQVDDYAYGGGAGMVMRCEPLAAMIEELVSQYGKYDEVIFLTPDGERLNQDISNHLSMKNQLLFICGRYKGIDQRIRDMYVTREISIGDYVLSGGELPAAVLADSIIRLIPGVLSDESSALLDSFQGELLDAPVYTRPVEFKGVKVPDVLLSGNQKHIDDWRYEQSLAKTKNRRPDLLED